MNEPIMQRVASKDGTPIAFWRSGAGPPLLLIHGATASHSTTWRYVRPGFEKNFTVYAMDRRGRGGSGDAPAYALEREAEDVAAVVDSIDEPANVLGHSFGALCALEAALLTSNMRRLVLYEGVPLGGGELYAPEVAEQIQELLDKGDAEGALITMYRDIVGVGSEELEALRAQTDAWAVRIENTPTLPRELKVEEEYDLRPQRFHDMRVPTLLLVGGDSPLRESRNARGVADALPDARVAVLPGEQHTAMYTSPDLFVAEVSRFLQE